MKMRIAAAAVAGMTMFAGSALADGMRGSIKDAPVAVAPTWSGFYVGAGIGYGHFEGENNYYEDGSLVSSSNSDGASGGFGTIMIGFDRQIRERYVIGAFAEYEWSDIRLDDVDGPDNTHFTVTNSLSIGARAGFLMTPVSLLYVTGGYTWAEGESNGYFNIPPLTGATSLDFNGPFVGLGMETLLGRGFALRGEVRYTMFDEITTNSGTIGPDEIRDTLEGDLLTARLAVTYKFNRPDPHVAPIK